MNTSIKTNPLDTSDAFVALHARRNFSLNVIEGGLFMFGINMMSSYTVLPYFVKQFSDQQLYQGLIPTIANIGWLLPGLFVAPYIAQLWTRKTPMLVASFFERIPWLLMGVWLFMGNTFTPSTTLMVFFGLYTMHTFSAGATAVIWQDYIGRVIPAQRWGTFFGMQSGLGSLLGVAGAAVATQVLAGQAITVAGVHLLGSYTFPFSIGVLSLICFSCLVVSFVFLLFTVEPRIPPQPKQPIWDSVKQMPHILRQDHMFRTYLLARTGVSLGILGHSFVMAAVLNRFQSAGEMVGAFTVVLSAAQALGNFGLGALADRWGHKHVLVLSGFIGALSLLLAWVAPTEWWYFVIFVCGGIAMAGYQLSSFSIVMLFSTSELRPLYIATANTFNVPVMALAPIGAGWLAGEMGFIGLFVLLAVFGVIGALVLQWKVTLPQKAPLTESIGQA
jgi:MFS family permease